VKQVSSAAERNKRPILDVIAGVLPERGSVLEIASGSGQHAPYLAAALGDLRFQPSDADASAVASIAAYREEAALPNLDAPVRLDVMQNPWPVSHSDAVLCFNMIHIAPWQACLALLRGAAAILAAGAPLVLYGPYRIDGDFTAPSNVEFDASLRRRNPAWGLR
jgi:hypothetical protein